MQQALGRDAAECLIDIGLVVDTRELLVGRARRLAPVERGERRGIERRQDRGQPFGPLRVVRAGPMVEAGGMAEQGRGHHGQVSSGPGAEASFFADRPRSGVYNRIMVRALVVALALLAAPVAAEEAEEALAVTVDAVIAEPVAESVRVLGRLVAGRRGVVATRVAGLVAEVAVAVGDRVAAGDPLARIDDRRLALDRTLALAALAEAEAAVGDAEAEAAVAAAAIETARARRETARLGLGRIEKLRNSDAFSPARFDDLTQEVVVAESLIAEAVARRQGALAEIERARAAVERARASLAIAEVDLADTRVPAPYDGVVTRRDVSPGAYVDVGDAIVELIDESSLEVEAEIPAEHVAPLAPGVAVTVDLGPTGSAPARVRAVIADENPMTRTRPVRFALGGLPDGLAAGQSVVLELPVGPPRTALTVAKDAVLRETSGAWVFVVVDGHAERRAVELGPAVGGRFEVLGGLAEGERVVVRGNERLQAGQAVSF